jgi:hypothetical protein
MPLDNVIFPKQFSLGERDPEKVKLFQQALFRAASDAQPLLSYLVKPAGTKILRNVPANIKKEHAILDWSGRRAKSFKLPCSMTAEEAATIPAGSSQKTNNRWSGQIKGTNISSGALYTCLDPISFANEALRYTRGTTLKSVPWKGSPNGKAEYTVFGPAAKDFGQMLVNRIYFVFTTTTALRIANLNPSASATFYEAIESNHSYQIAKQALRVRPHIRELIFDLVDYTASRPIGLAILLGKFAHALTVQSAQKELSTEESGENLVLGGADGQILKFLRPSGRLAEGTEGGIAALLEIPGKTGTADRIVLPGFVLPTSNKEI